MYFISQSIIPPRGQSQCHQAIVVINVKRTANTKIVKPVPRGNRATLLFMDEKQRSLSEAFTSLTNERPWMAKTFKNRDE